MVLCTVRSAFNVAASVIFKRNYGTSYVLCAKVADPIQQLFVDKIREFNSRITDNNFIKDYPQLQKDLDEELMRITRQYGGEKPQDLEKFPQPKMEESTIDPQRGF